MSPASSPVKISQLRQIRRNTFALCGVAAGRASRKSHDANLLAQRAKQRSPESGLRSPPLNLSELIDADMSVLEKVRQLVSEKMDARRHTSQLLHHLAILGRRRAGVPRPPPPGRPPPAQAGKGGKSPLGPEARAPSAREGKDAPAPRRGAALARAQGATRGRSRNDRGSGQWGRLRFLHEELSMAGARPSAYGTACRSAPRRAARTRAKPKSLRPTVRCTLRLTTKPRPALTAGAGAAARDGPRRWARHPAPGRRG